MAKKTKQTTPIPTLQEAGKRVPRYNSTKASKRFIRTLAWVLIVCGLFLCGQFIRYRAGQVQLNRIQAETDTLYRSVMGDDIGKSPFGRLQFTHGKLSAVNQIGLDPLSVLAALSKPAVASLRVEGLSLHGKTGRVRGFFGPNTEGFDAYYNALTDDEQYDFILESKEAVFGGMTFSLIVELR